jgi:hypothetical protein
MILVVLKMGAQRADTLRVRSGVCPFCRNKVFHAHAGYCAKAIRQERSPDRQKALHLFANYGRAG